MNKTELELVAETLQNLIDKVEQTAPSNLDDQDLIKEIICIKQQVLEVNTWLISKGYTK